MKISLILALMFSLLATEAMAQRRPPRPRPPRPMPVPPPRRPVPAPVPRPVPPMPDYVCSGADLYHRGWLVHRFRWTQDCREALRDVHYRGRFCDDGALYDGRGYFIRQYSSQVECRSWL